MELDEASFQAWYGRWAPIDPGGVVRLLAGAEVRWWIAGGRAARVGAPSRAHQDTDVVVVRADLPALREHLSGWHLWQTDSGALRPLPPGEPPAPGTEQLWLRRDAEHPWALDVLLDRGADQWVYKRDDRVRLPWGRALHTHDGVRYLRPELALLHKARHDRPKDRADLAVAALDPSARGWLADTLRLLGHHEWAALVAR